MPRNVDEEHGRSLLSAVERVLAPTDTLVALAAKHRDAARESTGDDETEVRRQASQTVIRHYSNRAMVVGAAATLPGSLPGVGTVVALVSGTVLDVTFLLKWEVEMALVLSELHGFDIQKNAERQLAFLMASVGTYDAQSGKNFVLDVLSAEREAVWNYTPRRMGKAIATVLGFIALMRLGRGFMRLVPLVGPLVGAVGNKVLTQRVGERCRQDFETRRMLTHKAAAPAKKAVARGRRPVRASKRRAPASG